MTQNPKPPKPRPFTEEQIRARAKALWSQRGEDSTDAENWADAIKEMYRERALKRVTKPLRRWWWRTGLGSPLQRWWEWTGIKEKKGWDFLQLLIAPVLLGAIALGLQEYVKEHDQKVADDKAKQDTLVKYLDQMADSMKDDLLTAKPGDKRFIVAQARTVLALQSLDKKRQHLVVQFLQATGFNKVGKQRPLGKDGMVHLRSGEKVLLFQAQLSKANLVNSDLSGAMLISVNLEYANLGCKPPEGLDPIQCSDLSGTNLRAADLKGADLSGANLFGAKISDANLWGANLQGANLKGSLLASNNIKLANFTGADLEGAIIISTDFSQAVGLTSQQLEGSRGPFFCHVGLPKGVPINPNRDCDRMPQLLLQRYRDKLKTLEEAEMIFKWYRRQRWPDSMP